MITRLYFETLFAQSLLFVEGAPLTREPPSIERVRSVLAPALAQAGAASAFRDPGADVAEAVLRNRPDETAPVGLNTIGMLLDRFSILAIKVWNLSHRSGDAARAQALRSGEVADLAAALASARPGYSSLNTKISVHRVEAEAADFRSAYTGLLTTNLLLWEAQEVLYNRDIAVLPAEELRQYVSYFSQGNLRRNQFIERSDACYWAGLRRLADEAREGSGP